MSIQELLILSFLFEIYSMKFITLIFNFYSFSVMVIVMRYLVLHILILFKKIVYVMLKLEHYVFNPSLNLCSSLQSLVFIRYQLEGKETCLSFTIAPLTCFSYLMYVFCKPTETRIIRLPGQL